MQANDFRTRARLFWRQWFTFKRLVPLATVGVAIVVGVLALFGVLQTTRVEGIIIALLGLLALDSLTERMSLLEKIESQLRSLPKEGTLRDRSQLPEWTERGRSANEIIAAGVSLVSLIGPEYPFFEQKLKDGCKLRFLLLDPASPSVEAWERLVIVRTTESDIRSTLGSLGALVRQQKRKGRIEVRLAPTFMPFNLVMFDPTRSTGWAVVEFYTYKATYPERPHVLLTCEGDGHWFEAYHKQFERLWSESEEWKPE